ncbi:hypothetical protein ACWEKM_19390 [Streptomyces sp. NPDC004752]
MADEIARTVQVRSDQRRPELARAMTLAVACLAVVGLPAAAHRTERALCPTALRHYGPLHVIGAINDLPWGCREPA